MAETSPPFATTIFDAPPIQISPSALNEVKLLLDEKDLSTAEHGLRIGVKGGGCSGMTYILGFDTQQEGDEIFEIDGIKVFMNQAHGMYLLGMKLDYVNGLENRGFTFTNPNASDTCGCGSSFAV
ncbi:MAG: iron-sulfur cluster assembly accessory protein [Chitinophagales bacterium]|jgi:iron-sulfur cluster assembly protein|nr:iron-sulfur cluster assembly accessory protein [Sphingobacteriales bacterium]MBP9140366.1 iron-sulfur cluster assembly accessory protein [Chitinophagales bacterium]MDA0199565.1 iron-sulfur cluster assembly accessory protein [Bacteroidota bacterium]MBK6890054.1 iron-sulfur cluster assembly accessory protein [Sphingobacteriales bacterium]MBK8678232.1 iron-sulfur cluster assembly accessory protein [Sphingobacteriales bacterium]